MYIPIFNLIMLTLLVICFSIFIYKMAYQFGKIDGEKQALDKLSDMDNERAMGLIRIVKKIKVLK